MFIFFFFFFFLNAISAATLGSHNNSTIMISPIPSREVVLFFALYHNGNSSHSLYLQDIFQKPLSCCLSSYFYKEIINALPLSLFTFFFIFFIFLNIFYIFLFFFYFFSFFFFFFSFFLFFFYLFFFYKF